MVLSLLQWPMLVLSVRVRQPLSPTLRVMYAPQGPFYGLPAKSAQYPR
ncbi:hypothetical protein [Salmonella phage NINP13076]|nr:hypothetical protein [Salmonella phage NINP13076]